MADIPDYCIQILNYIGAMKRSLILILLLTVSLVGRVQAAVADTVTAGAYVISVHDINFRDKEYTMRFWLWFLYKNPGFNFTTQLDLPNAKSIEDPGSSVIR